MTTYTIAAILWGVASLLAGVLDQTGRGLVYALVCFLLLLH